MPEGPEILNPPSGPRLGIHSLGEPGLHLGRLAQESEHRFGCRIEADLKPNLLAATHGHFVVFFRDDCIIPRYGAAGARKFAFHVPTGFPNTLEAGGKETFEGSAIFPTAWFSERQHALDWSRAITPSRTLGRHLGSFQWRVLVTVCWRCSAYRRLAIPGTTR